MSIRILPLMLVIGLAGLAGCVTVGSNQGAYRSSLGSTTQSEAVNHTREILQVRYGYALDREVITKEQIRFTTDWKRHTPTDEEQAEGIESYRTRVEVQARPSRRSGGKVSSYDVTLEASCEVKREGGAWKKRLPESRKQYFESMASLLENEFKGGMRQL